jgi:hypothetical protein
MAIALNITTASRRAILAGLSFFPFIPVAAIAAAPPADPVLAALEQYAQARADAEIVSDAFHQVDRLRIAGSCDKDEYEAADARWQDAFERREDAASAVLHAKPTTEDGALELARFAAAHAEKSVDPCLDDLATDMAAACRSLGDWLIERRRARAEG